VIEPYGARLFESLHELAIELDLSDNLICALQKKAQGSSRRLSRKPTTPSKISKTPNAHSVKKSFETKSVQTEMVQILEKPPTAIAAPVGDNVLTKRNSSETS